MSGVCPSVWLAAESASLIAFPLSYWSVSKWLQSFAYKIELSNEWMTFILSALLAGFITLITVGYHVMRAASANPVKALRDE